MLGHIKSNTNKYTMSLNVFTGPCTGSVAGQWWELSTGTLKHFKWNWCITFNGTSRVLIILLGKRDKYICKKFTCILSHII